MKFRFKQELALILLFCFGIALAESSLHAFMHEHEHHVAECSGHHEDEPVEGIAFSESESETCLRCGEFIVHASFEVPAFFEIVIVPSEAATSCFSDLHISKSDIDGPHTRGPPTKA